MKTATHLRISLASMIVVLLLASCKKNENGGTADGQGFKASIEDSNSKTYLDGLQVKWSDSDQINVANTAGTQITFELTERVNSQSGVFYTGDRRKTAFFEAGGPYNAVYPATNSISGTRATITLPATQNILANGAFGVGYNPMVASSSNKTLSFKNVCGALRFQMVGEGITVKTLVLTTGDPNDRLSGTFTANCTDATMSYSSGGGNTITLTCPGSGTALNGTTSTYFYFMLPPGTLHGVTFTAMDASNNVVYTQTSSKNYTITRNNISPVNELEVPLVVTTTSPTYITSTTAKGGVSVANGTAEVTGICWGLSNTPDITDINDFHAEGTTAISMTLEPNTIYYVRAYAISAKGTCYYGEAIPFAARPNFTNGIIPYEFSVSASQKVYFSMGNLQYRANPSTWRFAESQCDYIGTGNENVSSTYSGWIDLYSWGTSGYNHRAKYYQPWSITEDFNGHYASFYAYDNSTYNLNSSTGKADWGYNKISNGGNAEGQWRTLTGGASGEWRYLLNTRSGWRYSYVSITAKDGITHNGIILYPDGFIWPSIMSDIMVTYNALASFSSNHLTEAQWSLLENVGVVFLPLCGGQNRDRNDSNYLKMNRVNSCGWYWSSTKHASYLRQAHLVDFQNNYMSDASFGETYGACAVRLVKNKP